MSIFGWGAVEVKGAAYKISNSSAEAAAGQSPRQKKKRLVAKK
jgi:hypothetical protein